jgi:two-component system, chemotaxis family, response regulator PixH
MATVLVVEDTLTEAEIIISTLRGAGYEAVRVGSSEEAKEKIVQQRPDLIVLDVVLPGV